MNMQANYASGHCTSPVAFEVKYIKGSHKVNDKKCKIHKIQNYVKSQQSHGECNNTDSSFLIYC